jgi:hypothetical protein
MPNWCENEVWITGNADELQELFTEASKPNLSYDNGESEAKFLMDNLVPVPKELLEGDGWYNWRLGNWGTKWDLNQDYDDTRIYYTEGDSEGGLNYQTAWSPNRAFWLAVSERFPSLTIDLRYVEEGMCFMGQEIMKEGQTIEEVYHNDIPDELSIEAGAVFGEDGEIDWDESNLDYWRVFPLIKEEELV